jgi:hypothetical protein
MLHIRRPPTRLLHAGIEAVQQRGHVQLVRQARAGGQRLGGAGYLDVQRRQLAGPVGKSEEVGHSLEGEARQALLVAAQGQAVAHDDLQGGKEGLGFWRGGHLRGK